MWMRVTISGLESREYEHPFDRRALAALEKTPGLDVALRKFHQYWTDKLLKVQFTGSNIKVTSRNYPVIYRTFSEACEILSIQKVPDLYIKWGYEINAFVAGVQDPIVVLNSGMIDLLTEEEMLFVIGHELGHIKSEHMLYHQMGQVLPVLGDVIGSATLGFGKLLSTGLSMALYNWMRMSEFTCDRAGLLVCQDTKVAAGTLVKMAGVPRKYFDDINVEEFIVQAKEFESFDYNALDKFAKIMSTMWQSHPWIVMRAAEFFKWVDSGEYDEVLGRERTSSVSGTSGGSASHCHCGAALVQEQRYCGQCGKEIESA